MKKKLTNSDIVFLNYFYYLLNDGEYNTQVQEMFFAERARESASYKFAPN